ncbi:unnamed protein product [Echinostoma caproni]|uniref:Uncharacterized protein n=1 Tax=Echinostoma caproni TaxID=27848 RepID=A0A183AJR0_9TREM|nr:unnamed protein product [Echinostoma caproni]
MIAGSHNLSQAYDGGIPRLKTSTILRVLFSPPFYPPLHTDHAEQEDNPNGQVNGKMSRGNRTRNSNSRGRGSRKTVWLGGGFITGDDDLTGIGILLGLVIAVGLFVCFVLLIVTILLRQAHHLRQRRRLVNITASPKHADTGSDAAQSNLTKKPTPTPDIQLMDTQLYTPFVGLYHSDAPSTFLSIQRTGWKEPVLVDPNSMCP